MIANQVLIRGVGAVKGTGRFGCPICGTPNPLQWLAAPDRFHGRTKEYQLLRCAACSIVWLDDPPSKIEMGIHYGADYDRTISAAAQAPEHWSGRHSEVVRLLPEGGAVLDLGCGTGGFLSTLKGPSWKLYGLEMSEAAAEKARTCSNAQVFVSDILDAPFAPQSFDLITCFNVFEHLHEPKEVLLRLYNWLKPGGIFYALLPNIDSAGARIFGSYWYALELPRHLYHYSPASFRRIANSAGLREVSLTTHHELFFEYSTRFLYDALLKKLGVSRPTLAQSVDEASLTWRVVRKVYRLTLLQLFSAAASLVGDGETITAIFAK